MLKGASMAVSGPRVLELATGEQVSPEDLGGWKVHAEETGFADAVGETEDECLDLVRRFHAYLPSNAKQPPPRQEAREPGGDLATIADLVPEARNRAYDMTKLIRTLADGGEVFQVKERFGRTIVTALARIEGHAVGFLANQPMHKAGACDADGCDKAISFLCLCDSFNIPLVFHEVIDPADTRQVIARFLELSRTRSAVGRHRLASWPTKF